MFVNMFLVIRYLLMQDHYQKPRKTIYCAVWEREVVQRSKKHRWFVRKTEFPRRYYPPYCSGSNMILTADSVVPLYTTALRTKFLWVDDVFLSGIVAPKCGVKLHKINTITDLLCKDHVVKGTMHKVLFCHVSSRMYLLEWFWKNLMHNYLLTSTSSQV
ncbi:unnamed protein product [Soboliphyme baturini]|uniref:Hexosyltransferase n=1 Tax=Soboliphyme baturini TaxID=241478 RepID=A0A183J7F6_9BILA|nr:unnamed protein product [Soboliphyme baturini]